MLGAPSPFRTTIWLFARLSLTAIALLSIVCVATHAQQPTPPDVSTYASVASLVREKRFSEAEALLRPHADSTAPPAKALFALAIVHVHAGNLEKAAAAAKQLRALGTRTAIAYADKLDPDLAAIRRNYRLREELGNAIGQLNGERAQQVLASMEVADRHRAVVGSYLETYRGRFTSALLKVSGGAGDELGKAVADPVKSHVVESGARFRALSEQLKWYWASSLASSGCTPDGAREIAAKSELSLLEYVRLAEMGLQLFPLNDWFVTVAFHAALLSAPYEQVEQLGDRILEGGRLRIPFFSGSARFWVVLDKSRQRIYTELDADAPVNLNGSDDLSSHTLFDLSFSQVRSLEQKAKNDTQRGGIAGGAYALKLEPAGMAPHYLFMPFIHCLYGEAAQKQVTRNLGRYLAHVISRSHKVRVDLEDPGKVTRDWLSTLSGAVGAGTVVVSGALASAAESGRSPYRALDVTRLNETMTDASALLAKRAEMLGERAALDQAQAKTKRTWSEALAATAFASWSSALEKNIQELIGLLDVDSQ